MNNSWLCYKLAMAEMNWSWANVRTDTSLLFTNPICISVWECLPVLWLFFVTSLWGKNHNVLLHILALFFDHPNPCCLSTWGSWMHTSQVSYFTLVLKSLCLFSQWLSTAFAVRKQQWTCQICKPQHNISTQLWARVAPNYLSGIF